MIRPLAIATIVATLALLAAAPAAGAAASNGSTATPTPTASNATDFSADHLVEWASEGADLSRDRAEQAFAWFVEHQSAFAGAERQAVRSWLSEQVSGQSSESRDTGGQSVYTFGDDESDETATFGPAKQAIADGEVTDNELPDPYEYRGKRIFPGVRLEYEEWSGDRTTLILHAEHQTEISMNDAWLASAETDRPSPRHHATLDSGLTVIQMPTIEDSGGEEYIAMSTDRYVETISDPFQPFIERVSKRHIPAVAGGSIIGFVTLFMLFASFRTNRYRGRLVHIAEALRMR